MDACTSGILKQLKANRPKLRPKYRAAVDKFEMWQAYYDHVVGGASGNPNIIAMALTQKILAYTGIAESLFPKKLGASEKVKRFFNNLDRGSKFLLTMSVQHASGRLARRKREDRIVKAFVNENSRRFDKYFSNVISRSQRSDDNRGSTLWNLRCRLVHKGEFVIAVILGSTRDILHSSSPGNGIRIDEHHMSLDEAFLRGICAKARIRVSAPKDRVNRILITRGGIRTPR